MKNPIKQYILSPLFKVTLHPSATNKKGTIALCQIFSRYRPYSDFCFLILDKVPSIVSKIIVNCNNKAPMTKLSTKEKRKLKKEKKKNKV